jgi:RNA polymerase sigma-70 factor, ECF subfamily
METGSLLESRSSADYLIGGAEVISGDQVSQEGLYKQAADEYGAAIGRLARAYEADAEARRDLLQDIHLQLWRSFENFDGRCSVRTWVYRVAHNVATGHVIRQRRISSRLVSLEEVESLPGKQGTDETAAIEQLSAVIQRLKPLDRQIIVLYLEGMDAVSTGEITGLTPGNVAMKVHRIKNLLRRWFHGGGAHAK